jgi:hypothetical protein
MGQLEDLSCTQKSVWWLVFNPRPLGATAPQKRKKSRQILGVIWKTLRIRGLNGKHYRQTSRTNFVGYLKVIRVDHILSQNIRKSSR